LGRAHAHGRTFAVTAVVVEANGPGFAPITTDVS
jgi:hypothetical protein